MKLEKHTVNEMTAFLSGIYNKDMKHAKKPTVLAATFIKNANSYREFIKQCKDMGDGLSTLIRLSGLFSTNQKIKDQFIQLKESLMNIPDNDVINDMMRRAVMDGYSRNITIEVYCGLLHDKYMLTDNFNTIKNSIQNRTIYKL